MNLANIPQVLKDLPIWVCWRYETKPGETKPTKVPISVRTGKLAASTRPREWTDFESAVVYSGRNPVNGIGCVFAPDGGMVGLDLDKCIDDSGTVADWAAYIAKEFDTYTEISPSGTGLKLWMYGTLPDNKGRSTYFNGGKIEVYPKGRYFTVTGNSWPGTPKPISNRQATIDRLYAKFFAKPDKPVEAAPPPPVDGDLIASVVALMKSDKLQIGWPLYQGIVDKDKYPSPSEADFHLCMEGVYYGLTDEQIVEFVNQSKLPLVKWNERGDYRERTIKAAREKQPRRHKWKTKTAPGAEATGYTDKTPDDDCADVEDLIRKTISGQRRNIPFLWPMLSAYSKCLLPGSVTLLCGGGGSTKSLFINEACIDWVHQDISWAAFHLEEDRGFHGLRGLAQIGHDTRIMDDDWQRDNPDDALKMLANYRDVLSRVTKNIWDAPAASLSLPDIYKWVESRCKEGRRIMVVDPITATDPDGDQWTADKRFIIGVKNLMRKYGASIILVTHPRGNAKGADRLDQMAGSRAYSRFSSSVLWLESVKPEMMKVRCGMGDTFLNVNRIVQIWKARSGPGNGVHIGYYFDPKTFRFKEQGAIIRDKK